MTAQQPKKPVIPPRLPARPPVTPVTPTAKATRVIIQFPEGTDINPARLLTPGDIVTITSNKTLKTAKIDHATSGDNEIVGPVPGKKIKVYAIVLVVTGAVNCKWRSASTDLTGDMNFGGKGEGYSQATTPPAFLLQTVASKALNLNLSAAVAVDGYIAYWDDDEI